MAKTYLSTVKYEALIEFEISGVVDKHDIIGAVFGQSEGLLGETLDLRELQKNGKIGRIEIELTTQGGRTRGRLTMPSSLDMVETSVLAAAIETVDKVGPCDSKFVAKAISDTRSMKRMQVVSRAKQLLEKLMSEQIPESAEITKKVRDSARIAEVREYGIGQIAAGPEVEGADEIIIVEGRADVLNLLKHGIKNAVAMAGSNIPREVIELCKKKKTIVFIDGDRGGSLILRKLQELANVDYVARAPAGKEVEELTGKEILMALRRKIPLKKTAIQSEAPVKKTLFSAAKRKPVDDAESKKLKEIVKGILGSMKGVLLDEKLKEIKTVEIRDLLKEIEAEEKVHAVAFDGIVTKRLVETAEASKVKVIAGIKEGKFIKPKSVKIVLM